MKLYPINQRLLLRSISLIALFAVTLVCIFLLTHCVGSNSASNGVISVQSKQTAADGNNIVAHGNGPTFIMGSILGLFIAGFMLRKPRKLASPDEKQK